MHRFRAKPLTGLFIFGKVSSAFDPLRTSPGFLRPAQSFTYYDPLRRRLQTARMQTAGNGNATAVSPSRANVSFMNRLSIPG
jgi:hypothetical protein